MLPKEHVQEVLWRLCKHGLYVKPEKCEFHTNSTEYLRYQLSPSRLTMSSDKIQTIQNWPEPWKIKDIQSFLEFTNFYQQFIDNYSNIVTPLTRPTCKVQPGASVTPVIMPSPLLQSSLIGLWMLQ